MKFMFILILRDLGFREAVIFTWGRILGRSQKPAKIIRWQSWNLREEERRLA